VSGSLSSGLHHARYGRGARFCTFNGLVLAARAALADGAESVVILDLDAHGGGGTASLIADDPRVWQLDVSVSSYDREPDANPERLWWDMPRSGGAEYLDTIRRQLDEVDRRGPTFDLCLYNAGMDPCDDGTAGWQFGITPRVLADRERLVFEWCRSRGLPVAFVPAGGYVGPGLDEAAIVNLHRLTLSAATGVQRVPAD
jgi:acetoin utilization deacetylase AcuC-like enzyme